MPQARTHVSADGETILINGEPTYAGTGVEGLLFNVRTVNATFDDTLGEVDWWDDDGSHATPGMAPGNRRNPRRRTRPVSSTPSPTTRPTACWRSI